MDSILLKKKVVEALIENLQRMAEDALRSVGNAHEEMHIGSERTRNKGERGKFLESAYLLSARSRQADECAIAARRLAELDLTPSPKAREGSLLEVAPESGGGSSWVLLASGGMGQVFEIDRAAVEIVSPESPMGHALLGRRAGGRANVRMPSGVRALRVLSVQ